VFRRAIVDHHFATAARAVDLQARLRGFTGPAAAAMAGETRRRLPGSAAETAVAAAANAVQ
jgi:hypothetical protein